MSKNKPSLPQGTRDFDPSTVRKRRYIFDTIRPIFELYGYQPLETPAMENLETLILAVTSRLFILLLSPLLADLRGSLGIPTCFAQRRFFLSTWSCEQGSIQSMFGVSAPGIEGFWSRRPACPGVVSYVLPVPVAYSQASAQAKCLHAAVANKGPRVVDPRILAK